MCMSKKKKKKITGMMSNTLEQEKQKITDASLLCNFFFFEFHFQL